MAVSNLNAEGRAAVLRAYDEAYGYASDFVGSAHLLMGLVADTTHVIAAALLDREVDTASVRRRFEQTTGARRRESPRLIHLVLSPHAQSVLITAAECARVAGLRFTEVDQLWLAISRADGAAARQLLADLGQLDFVRQMCGDIAPPSE